MKTLKIDPFSGISGDMFLGALLDISGQHQLLTDLPRQLGLEGTTVEVKSVNKCGITCKLVNISTSQTQSFRHLTDILAIIEHSPFNTKIKAYAERVIRLIGQEEAKIHGMPVDQVHFHEIGAVDTIIDVIGSAVLLDSLAIQHVLSDPVCCGYGMITCDHGRMPIPAPATQAILKNIPTFRGTIPYEMTTPTGAALLVALDPIFDDETFHCAQIGYGAGSRDFAEQPNCLRLSLGAVKTIPTKPGWIHGHVYVVQSNIDDMPAELLGSDFQDLLFTAGALDVAISPIHMKKGRSACQLEILCREAQLDTVISQVLTHTSAIGVRYFKTNRAELAREVVTIDTKYGQLAAKRVTLPNGQTRIMPEYEPCKQLADSVQIPVLDIYRTVEQLSVKRSMHDLDLT